MYGITAILPVVFGKVVQGQVAQRRVFGGENQELKCNKCLWQQGRRRQLWEPR